ncbi:hypothetical protein SRHO_G00174610 [Serrasalmus rhombeus]
MVRILVSHLIERDGETPALETKKNLASSLVTEFPYLRDQHGNGNVSASKNKSTWCLGLTCQRIFEFFFFLRRRGIVQVELADQQLASLKSV